MLLFIREKKEIIDAQFSEFDMVTYPAYAIMPDGVNEICWHVPVFEADAREYSQRLAERAIESLLITDAGEEKSGIPTFYNTSFPVESFIELAQKNFPLKISRFYVFGHKNGSMLMFTEAEQDNEFGVPSWHIFRGSLLQYGKVESIGNFSSVHKTQEEIENLSIAEANDYQDQIAEANKKFGNPELIRIFDTVSAYIRRFPESWD